MPDKTVLIDCDGVLADFVSPALAWGNERAGTSFTRGDVTEWDLFDLYPPDVRAAFMSDLMHSPDFWGKLPVVPEARAGVNAIRRLGYDVVICTSPWRSCPNWEGMRRAWLKDNFDIPGKQIISASLKYLVGGVTLIDDKAEHVTQWGETHPGAPVLFDSPWNQQDMPSYVTRAKGWPEVVAAVMTAR